MKIENIKVCAFDAYGTCFDINSAAQKLSSEIGEDWLSFSSTWRTVQLEYTWLRSLMKKYVDFWKITEDSLDFAMDVHKINIKFKNQLLNLYKKLNAYPELSNCLEYLRDKKIKTCILSNGSPILLNDLVNHANVKSLFDNILSVDEIKVYKPDPKVYEMVTKKYKCTPNEVCFMSSNTWDVVGGGAYGFHTCWVNRFEKEFDRLDYQPDKIIKDLSDLSKLF